MIPTLEKLRWIYEKMRRERTLYSDLTWGDSQNFGKLLDAPGSYWMELVQGEEVLGLVYLMGLGTGPDLETHIVLFRRLTIEDGDEYAELVACLRALSLWVFGKFLNKRLTAVIPNIYFRTKNLVGRIGFKGEGRKRKSLLLGGRWVDEVIYGLLREDLA